MAEIRDYIKAGFSCLFLRTIEPHVAEEAVKFAIESIDDLRDTGRFGVWKATTGFMVKKISDVGEARPEVGKDFSHALEVIQKATQETPIVGVFHNIRQFIGNYVNIQRIIDAAMSARESGSHIIFIGPELVCPPELHHMITFIDMPLPSKKDLMDKFKKQIDADIETAKDNKIVIDFPSDKEEATALIGEAATAALGLDSLSAECALTLSIATHRAVDIQTIQKQKAEEVRKSDVLEFFTSDETLDDVGGFDEYKTWVSKRIRAFSQEARDYHLPYPQGVLFIGPAGTGKSLVAKATAKFLRLPLVRMDIGKIFRSLVGDSEAATRLALKTIEAISPVVLWLDEIEKGLAGMEGSGSLDSGVTSRVTSTILTWKQETKSPVFLVATANNIAGLPSMVYRKGRMDEVWATDLPLDYERESIFDIHLRKYGRDPSKFDIASLAANCEDFTGAEIEGCVVDALYSAFDAEREVTTPHILRSIKETVPQAKRNREELENIREWSKTRARQVSSGAKKVKGKGAQVRKLRSSK